MDPITGLLDGPRARGAFLLRSLLDPPWALRIEDHAPLTVVVVLRGDAQLTPDGQPTIGLRAGDVALIRGPESYELADAGDTPVQIVIDEDQMCHAVGDDATPNMGLLGVRTWGTRDDAATSMLCGTYASAGEVSRRLLLALPQTIVLPSAEWDTDLAIVLARESARDAPGQAAILDRLLDVVLVAALRAWLSRPDSAAPGWLRAQADPIVGPALRALHEDPTRRWTLATLAATCGISRAALARRFADLVGEPPMAYLTDRRLALAADLLLEPGATVGAVAARVGYGSAFALSTAFRRVRGISPTEHRRRAA